MQSNRDIISVEVICIVMLILQKKNVAKGFISVDMEISRVKAERDSLIFAGPVARFPVSRQGISFF